VPKVVQTNTFRGGAVPRRRRRCGLAGWPGNYRSDIRSGLNKSLCFASPRNNIALPRNWSLEVRRCRVVFFDAVRVGAQREHVAAVPQLL
jgi:hypothetical protein